MLDEWNRLVKGAKSNDRECFEKLLSQLEPLFYAIALKLNYDTDELVQIARIAVWKAINNVKIRTSKDKKTSRMYLVTAGINDMKTKVRNEKYRMMRSIDLVDKILFARFYNRRIFDGDKILSRYLEYIKLNGDMKGAHQTIAKEKGITLWTVRRQFHLAVKEFLSEKN